MSLCDEPGDELGEAASKSLKKKTGTFKCSFEEVLSPLLLKLSVFVLASALIETFLLTGPVSPQKNSDSHRRSAPVLR